MKDSLPGHSTTRAIEDGFPFELVSRIADVESWRKEVWRPVYHTHKWWAQRLGSVFRAAIIGSLVSSESDVMEDFYRRCDFTDRVVFDPFMGSGTTVGEAVKLGCSAVGRDINPVAYRSVSVALSRLSETRLAELYGQLESTVGREIRELYQSVDSSGHVCDVLYWFWVKHLPCPECSRTVDLFSTHVFARHAYVRRHPEVHVVCPNCGEVFPSQYPSHVVACPSCGVGFDQHQGAVRGAKATCSSCANVFPIARTARAAGHPPEHRLYAKLVLRRDGTKEYLEATDDDLVAYESAERRLREMDLPLPSVRIADGYNTRQVLNYGYVSWDQFFNSRQHLALGLLAKAIADLPNSRERDALGVLFSGVLEFNNMFASYKGEGTGAVRHMFSHHVLKPERTPIEANVWGTAKSSGSFSTLFRSRLLRALDYKAAPFEIRVEAGTSRAVGHKVVGLSQPMDTNVVDEWPRAGLRQGDTYLSCGDSARTDLPDGSVDVVITDPPFFDNVHYSELADFFHVWQRLWFGWSEERTTRQSGEVQDTDADSFAEKLAGVFRECCRVLTDTGLMVFSYHHSREDGWSAVARAVLEGGFVPVQAQPVKSEMSVAVPKAQANSPIDLDVLMVCRKRKQDSRSRVSDEVALRCAVDRARSRLTRFNQAGRLLSRNDVRVVLSSLLLVELTPGRTASEVVESLALVGSTLPAEDLFAAQHVSVSPEETGLFSLPT